MAVAVLRTSQNLDDRIDTLMRRLDEYIDRYTRAIRAAELARECGPLAAAIEREIGVEADVLRRVTERLETVSENLQHCP